MRIKKLDLKEEGKLFNCLVENRFILSKKLKAKDEINHFIKKNNLDFDKPFFKIFYIIVTTGCNFRCKYCYLSSLVNYTPRVMNTKTAKEILNYFYKYISKVNDEVPKLVLYGGEPLLNKKVVEFIIKDIRKNTKEKKIPLINIILITNGSLMDKGIARFLKKYNVRVAVSLDGPKRINNANRVYKDGRGTYEDTIKSIELLSKSGVKPTISCTVSETNVNMLPEVISWLYNKFKNIDSISLNLFAGGDCSNKVIKQLSKDSAVKVVNAFETCRKYGIYEDTALRRLKEFINEKPNFYYCAATGREISADPDGNIAPCPAFLNSRMFPINVKQKLNLEKDNRFRRWVKRSPIFNRKCHKCIALGVCGGGCAFTSYKNHKNIYAIDEFYCNYAKNVTEWMLKDLYKKSLEAR